MRWHWHVSPSGSPAPWRRPAALRCGSFRGEVWAQVWRDETPAQVKGGASLSGGVVGWWGGGVAGWWPLPEASLGRTRRPRALLPREAREQTTAAV